jgi:hypothetical protein
MRDPRISFGSRGLAAVLGFLIPGAGHLYQGRRLKAGIFAVCILSTFFAGLVLGEGQPVYSQIVSVASGGRTSAQLHTGPGLRERSLGYYAQLFVGIPALPALVQSWRYGSAENSPAAVELPLDAPFEGNVLGNARNGGQHNMRVNGQLQLQAAQGQGVTGTLTGTSNNGDAVSLAFTGRSILGKPVFGSPRRQIECEIVSDDSGLPGQLIGTIDRPFLDWFQAPRDNEELDRMHSLLSQKFDIACVFTWIAGLLNIMAVWDAFDGPAYGYGDEDVDESDNNKKD